MVMLTKRRAKLAIISAVLVLYGVSMVLSMGKLPNQTATLITVQESEIRSLIPKENVSYTDLSLNREHWNITGYGQDTTANNSDHKLIIWGLYRNWTSPFFIAEQTGLDLNFTATPYLKAIVSSKPDQEISFLLGWRSLNESMIEEFVAKHPGAITETDDESRIRWINISLTQGGEKIDDNIHHITINVSQRLVDLGLEEESFVGLQIRQYLVGLMLTDNRSETTFESIHLLDEPQYHVSLTEEKWQTLPDESIVHIIRKNDTVNHEDCPYLQRAYVQYRMDAPEGTLYTIFLLCKSDGNLTSVRCGFVFSHENLLNDIGTYVDWRMPIQLDSDFEPIGTLQDTLDNGDYAVVFTPLKGSQFHSIQLDKVVFTFSKLPYSAFIIPSISEEVLTAASIFILAIAGALPTLLMFCLFYLYKKNRLEGSRNAIIKIVIVGLALRLGLAAITAYADDTQVFSEIGALFFGSGTFGAQWVSFPGFVYLETAAYFPYALLRALGFKDFHFLALDIYSFEALFTKLPSILCDLGSFYFILKMADRYAPKKKLLLAGLYLINPLTVYISAVLGQFDPIFTFALIAGIYYLVTEYDNVKATIFSSFAAILNPVGMAAFVPLFANVSLREGRKALAKSLLLVMLILSASWLPFFLEAKSTVVLASYERLVGGIPGEPFYGKQIRFYTYGSIVSSSVGYGLTFRFLLEILGFELGPLLYPLGAAFAFLILIGVFMYKIRKASGTDVKHAVYTGTFMLGVAALFQLTFPTIFDQFVVWVAGLLLVAYILSEKKELLLLFTIISIATGFIYVCLWRNYLQLISGVQTVASGNPFVGNASAALIGTLYSLVLLTAIIVIFKMWTQENNTFQLSKKHSNRAPTPYSPRRTAFESVNTE